MNFHYILFLMILSLSIEQTECIVYQATEVDSTRLNLKLCRDQNQFNSQSNDELKPIFQEIEYIELGYLYNPAIHELLQQSENLTKMDFSFSNYDLNAFFKDLPAEVKTKLIEINLIGVKLTTIDQLCFIDQLTSLTTILIDQKTNEFIGSSLLNFKSGLTVSVVEVDYPSISGVDTELSLYLSKYLEYPYLKHKQALISIDIDKYGYTKSIKKANWKSDKIVDSYLEILKNVMIFSESELQEQTLLFEMQFLNSH